MSAPPDSNLREGVGRKKFFRETSQDIGCWETDDMTQFGEYCPYAKAAEHLGDRWSLMIVKELAMYGSRGFNALSDGLPGVARSVLVRRLRLLEELGVIMRDPMIQTRRGPYRLAPAGEQLVPTLLSLDSWARRWVPEDPALALRDPDVITFWLTQRVELLALPDRQVVVVFDIGGPRATRQWLVLERGAPPSICHEDPGLALERYLYVEADAAVLYPIARGVSDWNSAIADESVRLYGDPTLVRSMPGWFRTANDASARPKAGRGDRLTPKTHVA
jgi:DNA-binding HxlR family transcriptional regulator